MSTISITATTSYLPLDKKTPSELANPIQVQRPFRSYLDTEKVQLTALHVFDYKCDLIVLVLLYLSKSCDEPCAVNLGIQLPFEYVIVETNELTIPRKPSIFAVRLKNFYAIFVCITLAVKKLTILTACYINLSTRAYRRIFSINGGKSRCNN